MIHKKQEYTYVHIYPWVLIRNDAGIDTKIMLKWAKRGKGPDWFIFVRYQSSHKYVCSIELKKLVNKSWTKLM